jgi:hypothetical protein
MENLSCNSGNAAKYGCETGLSKHQPQKQISVHIIFEYKTLCTVNLRVVGMRDRQNNGKKRTILLYTIPCY